MGHTSIYDWSAKKQISALRYGMEIQKTGWKYKSGGMEEHAGETGCGGEIRAEGLVDDDA